MFNARINLSVIAMLAICLPHKFVFAQNTEATELLFALDGKAKCVLAGHDASFTYLPVDMRSGAWHVEWLLATAHRTLLQGTGKHLEGTDLTPPNYILKITMPGFREGLVLPVKLRMKWRNAEGKEQQINRPLYVFSPNPFVGKQTFLKNAQIKLFDPEGKTAELLDKSEIPHTRLLNLSAIDLVTEGIILVGEGTSFREQRRLPQSLISAGQRGVSVLCLAPSDGDLSLAEQHSRKVTLERGDVVRRYDKRFDEIAAIRPLSLQARKGGMVISTVEENGPWSWVSMEFPANAPGKPSGKIVICGLGVISSWESGPVPRYLFARLLEDFTYRPKPLEEQKDASLSQ